MFGTHKDPEVAAMIQRLRHSPSYILNRDEARLRDDAAALIENLARQLAERQREAAELRL